MLEPLMSLRDRAEFYHRQLPEKVRRYLTHRGIPESMIERYSLGGNGRAITIPTKNENCEVVFIKTATPPPDGAEAPVIEVPEDAEAELYPWRTLKREI